jgi:MscS family membrane protein
MIPYRWIQAMPSWLRTPAAGQASWKWIAAVLILSIFVLSLRLIYRLSRWTSRRHLFLQSLAQLTLPAFFLAATPAVVYLVLVQISLTGNIGGEIQVVATAVMFLAGAWLFWRMPPVVAEAIITSPKIAPESINAHLIRIVARLLGIVAVAISLASGANRLGIPVYGIVAGLGVGGLAIALAAQPTVENLIGGMSLFADKPIRIGDVCQYGTEIGTVEAIGIRSTRIRGLDRKLTTIPNAALSKMSIINFDQRDRMLIRSVVSVRYETTPEQLRYLLVKIREMLLGHPRIHHDPARARFVGFGASSLDIEVYAYVKTREWSEFLGIREDVFLRIMDIVQESGTGFAFPSQTLYFGRDQGLDAGRAEAAEAQVRQWRDEGSLAFPNFSPEQMRKIRGSVVYPAPGTTEAEAEKTDGTNQKEN